MPTKELEPIFQEFLTYRSSSEPWLFHDRLNFTRRCHFEYRATFAGFPGIHDRSIRLCMAAWMALNLSLQDQFWSLNAQEVKLAVSGVVDMLNDFHEQGSPGETRRRLSNPLLGRFRHHTTQFRLLISELLAPSALTVVKSLILESLAGFYEHALWCNKVGGDASSYLAIKRKISGLSPLFYLVHISTPGETSTWSSTLRTMQNLVSTAAVLQKNLSKLRPRSQTNLSQTMF